MSSPDQITIDSLPDDDQLESHQQHGIRTYVASGLTGVPATEAKRLRRLRELFDDACSHCRRGHYLVYNPATNTPPGSNHSDDEVYLQNYRQVASADLLVLLMESRSWGGGMEAQIASMAAIPYVVFQRSGNSVTRMIGGLPSRILAKETYESDQDFARKAEIVLDRIATGIIEAMPLRRRIHDSCRRYDIGRRLMMARIAAGVSRIDLARRSSLSPVLVRLLETVPECATGLSEWQRHAWLLGLSIANVDELTAGPARLPTEYVESLGFLADFVRTRQNQDDELILQLWDSTAEMLNGLKGREPLCPPASPEEWEALYCELRNRRKLFE